MVVVPNATPLTPDDSTTEQFSIFRLLLRPSEYIHENKDTHDLKNSCTGVTRLRPVDHRSQATLSLSNYCRDRKLTARWHILGLYFHSIGNSRFPPDHLTNLVRLWAISFKHGW